MKNLLFLTILIFQLCLIPQANANPETLLDGYFEKLEDAIRLKDYKTHKAALTKFYEDRISKDFHRTVKSEYHFKSCLEGMKEEHSKTSLSQNRDEFLEALFPSGVVMIYRAFDHEIISQQVDEKNQEIKVDYSLDLGGDVVRSPGHQGIEVDYAGLADLRRCNAIFSINDNALIMESEQCEIVVKEGNLESWETKDFRKGGCDRGEGVPGAARDIENAITENFPHLPPICNLEQKEPCNEGKNADNQEVVEKVGKNIFSMDAIILYQEEKILKERLATDASLLAEYALRIEAEAREVFAKEEPQKGVSGAIVIAIKPGKLSRLWLVSGENAFPETLKETLLKKLSVIEAIPVKKGPIAIGLEFAAWGGGTPLQETHPIPKEWKEATQNQPDGVVPDAPLAVLWPDKQIVPSKFLGVWEGDLKIIHAPEHEAFADSMIHRFEFTDTSASIAQKHNKEWLYNKSIPEIVYKSSNHVFMHTVHDSGQYIQIYSFNFVHLGDDSMYVYVSRVVENYTLDKEEQFRHFPVFAQGILSRKNK